MSYYGYNNFYFPQQSYQSPLNKQWNEWMEYEAERELEERVSRLEDAVKSEQAYMFNLNASIQNLLRLVGEITTQLAINQGSINNYSAPQHNPIELESLLEITEVVKESIDEKDPKEEIVDEEEKELEIIKQVVVEEKGLIEKGEEIEELAKEEHIPKRVDKAEVEKVIDLIIALFNQNQMEEPWKPHHSYLKFMGFLQKGKKKKDEIFFLSYYTP